MTFSIRQVAACLAYRSGDTAKRKGFFGTLAPLYGATWEKIRVCRAAFEGKECPWTLQDVYVYLWGAHCGHALEFAVALLCYALLYADGSWLEEARQWQVGWVSRIVVYNLLCELVIVNFWHYMVYVSSLYDALLKGGRKLNPANQYEPGTGHSSMLTSATGNLEREITFTTLGWLQSSAWQCLFTHLWASGVLPVYVNFFACPVYSLLLLASMTYWREVHFFCAHRCMHPWWDRGNGLLDGDVGAFLYRHVHSLHHKSYNPGPWSGLCMHPVEHLLYYGCATLPPLVFCMHPLHFLYTKFHADIAPVGGHDGFDDPAGNGDFHWLHHAKFECNYGVPFPINLDKLFGTWADYGVWKDTGELTCGEWAKQQMHEAAEEEGKPVPTVQGGGINEPLLKAEAGAGSKRAFSMAEVALHRSQQDCWVVLYGQVLDVTSFISQHPGGQAVLLKAAGTDATAMFEAIHAGSGGFELVRKWLPDGRLGVVEGWTGPVPPEPEAETPRKWPGALLFFSVFVVAVVACLTH